MCIDVTAEDFATIHHELGHNFYQRAYKRLPMLFRDGANDGFHEAVGDTISLSITPEYLVKIGLLDAAPDHRRTSGCCSGPRSNGWRSCRSVWLSISGAGRSSKGRSRPRRTTRRGGICKLKYQNVAPPHPRGEEFFDPGAKYHVPANTPYSRYFLAAVLQFQFHRALAKTAGCTEPLHRCSIYESKAAGEKLKAMLEMGASTSVARCARGDHRSAADGRERDGGVLRAAQGVAR